MSPYMKYLPMRPLKRGSLPINKMADWSSRLSQWGFTPLCLIHGNVSWPGEGYEAGGIQLWCDERGNVPYISAIKTAGGCELVCELFMFYSSLPRVH